MDLNTLSRRETLDVMIVQGKSEEEIKEKLNYAPETIKLAAKKMRRESKYKHIDKLARASEPVVNALYTQLMNEAPSADVRDEAGVALHTINSLRNLERSFHNSFNKILVKANVILDSEDLTTKDWITVTNTLSSSFKDIFNSTGTTINVAQAGSVGNTDNSQNLTMFQDSKSN